MKWLQWIEDHLQVNIEFPVIADDGAVAEALGLVHPLKGNKTIRAVYLVDPDRKIRLILYYPQELGRNMDEIIRIIKAMQMASTRRKSQANHWPGYEVIPGDIEFPANVQDDKDRNKFRQLQNDEFQSYDWWVDHRRLTGPPHSTLYRAS